jgi:hypothetical protein
MLITSAATVTFVNGPRPCNAKRIEWVGTVTPGDNLVIADIGGNTIFKEQAPATFASVVLWPGPGKFMLPGKQASFASVGNAGGSWQVSTINSGTLMVWY